MRRGIFYASRSCLAFAMMFAAVSCGQRQHGNQGQATSIAVSDGADSVTAAEISRLRVGMTMLAAQDVLAPARPTPLSVPTLLYRASSGGIYYLAFYDSSAPVPSNEPHVLKHVVFFQDSEMKDGRYVLPQARRGQAFEPSPGTDPQMNGK